MTETNSYRVTKDLLRFMENDELLSLINIINKELELRKLGENEKLNEDY